VEQAGQNDVNAKEDDERIEVARAPRHCKKLEDCLKELSYQQQHGCKGQKGQQQLQGMQIKAGMTATLHTGIQYTYRAQFYIYVVCG
jgi:hypothetical protein